MSRQLGAISLVTAAVGCVATDVLIHQGVLAGRGWTVAAAGFEAATIGGVADWFAVSALFREVPLPFVRRHTDIIVRNRARITANLMDYVQNTLLTPAVIAAELGKIPFTRELLGVLGAPASRGRVHGVARELAARLASGLDSAGLRGFLERTVRERLLDPGLAAPAGAWLAGCLERGDHLVLWRSLAERAVVLVRDPASVEQLAAMLAAAAKDYKEQRGMAAKLVLWLGEKTGAADYREIAGTVAAHAAEWLERIHDDPGHELTRRMTDLLRDFAAGLAAGRADAVAEFDAVRGRLLAQADLAALAARVLDQLGRRLAADFADPESDASRTLSGLVDSLLAGLDADAGLQRRLDDQVRAALTHIVARHHARIGEMVGASLAPERIGDRDLVAQIEAKIGDDLQYIRLNGAVVGGLVGVAIGALKLLW
jgi:uncharacterized membrane-anchored protein YjiN (DUF445 family)